VNCARAILAFQGLDCYYLYTQEIAYFMRKLQVDKWLLVTVMLLLVFGLVMITSIGVPKSIQLSAPKILYPNCNDAQVDCYLLFKNHLVRMLIGLVVMFIVSKISFRFWKKTSVFWYASVVLMLMVVLAFGSQYTTFAKSWIVLFNTSLQPTEFAKLALIFYLAHWMERKNQEIQTFQYGFLPFCIVTGVLLFPILLQPDLGGVMIVGSVAAAMYFAAGAKMRHMALGAVIVFVLGLLTVTMVGRVHERFQAFLNQDSDCRESYCWQTEQANIAVGTGGFWGKGLTQGVQKSYWLPQASDDFIFAASAEELGFLRIAIVIIGYGIIAYRGLIIARGSPDRFTMLTAVGVTSWIVIQAYMNIMINIGMMPVTGITLPFVSYGGSSMIATLIGIGVLLQISKHSSYETGASRRGNRRTYNAKYSPY
jgi:cell division protein FtsW